MAYFWAHNTIFMLDQLTPDYPPKTWLAESILATLFCCLPFGVVGIVNAANVESRFRAGDYAGAERASAEAKRWTMISFWVGVVGFGLYALFLVGMVFFVASNGGFHPN